MASAGHVTIAITSRRTIRGSLAHYLDGVSVRLTSALAGEIGGRIAVRLDVGDHDITLEVQTARPGSWTRPLRRPSFDRLLTDVATTANNGGGSLEITKRPFGRLVATLRIQRWPTRPRESGCVPVIEVAASTGDRGSEPTAAPLRSQGGAADTTSRWIWFPRGPLTRAVNVWSTVIRGPAWLVGAANARSWIGS